MILYDITTYYNNNGTLKRCSVEPITVVREGCLPGCVKPSITAIATDGEEFVSSKENYYETETEAWAQVKKEVEELLADAKRDVKDLAEEVRTLEGYLKTLR